MTKAPPVPPAERPPHGGKPDISGKRREARDRTTGVQSGQPGDQKANFAQQGRQANTKQNLTPQHKTQAR